MLDHRSNRWLNRFCSINGPVFRKTEIKRIYNLYLYDLGHFNLADTY